jgi:uncharacterized protein
MFPAGSAADEEELLMAAAVLLVSSGLIHPSWLARRRLSGLLHDIPGFRIQYAPSLEEILRIPLEDIRGILLYVHHKRISPAALERLEDFVGKGGGLAALHSASASFKAENRYFDLLGGRFTGHGPVKEYKVLPAPPAGATFAGIEGFTVRDELYHHDYDSSSTIHFYTLEEGVNEPVAWTRTFGKGRVFYCSLGHTPGTLLLPPVRSLLRRGLEWSARLEPNLEGPPG